MNRLFTIIGLAILFINSSIGQADTIKLNETVIQNSNYIKGEDYSVYNLDLVDGKDSFSISELRIYKIESALDGIIMMSQNYNDWDDKYPGKYQDNINQVKWTNIHLTNESNLYTIIADGTESEAGFFASIIIYDEFNKNCLDENHPKNKLVLNSLLNKFEKMKFTPKAFKKIAKKMDN